MHARDCIKEGTITSLFDMVVLNHMDRYSLTIDALNRVPEILEKTTHIHQKFADMRIIHKLYIHEHGGDISKIKTWQWSFS